MARYGKHAWIDYSNTSSTNCHRRERHNRVNFPYKAHPCQSAEFCGDLSKHKDEKDVSRAVNELNNAKKGLEKLQNTLSMKIALKNQTSNSFSSLMRSRLINECKRPRYLNTQGFENWHQVNMDLKKLESHFKGKFPQLGSAYLRH